MEEQYCQNRNDKAQVIFEIFNAVESKPEYFENFCLKIWNY